MKKEGGKKEVSSKTDDMSNANNSKLEKEKLLIKKELLFEKIIFSIPDDWKMDTSYLDKNIYAFVKKDNKKEFNPSFTIEYYDLNTLSISFDSLVNSYIKTVTKNYDDCIIHNGNRIELDSFKEVKTINYSFKRNNDKFGSITTFYLNENGNAFLFNGLGINNKKNQILPIAAIFEEIFWSAKLK